ncbi:MAG TPA: FAD-dependent oxidoreductase [Kofleriaceae bacterium]|nr:FAD-dependent oxidoreductase [Kofleriaceae bacterium]
MHPSTSIAILGGGASGLTLARTLADLGFGNLVVFERGDDVGGKSCTVDIDGLPHDLGATMGVPIDYRPVVRFSDEAGLATVPFPEETHYSVAHRGPVALNRWHELPRVFRDAARYVQLHRRLWRPALHRADRALYAPWAELVAGHGLEAASRRMLCYRTGYGYGFDDEVPAVMYANLVRPQTLLGLAVGDPFMWRTGTQPIWRALARRIAPRVDVRTRTEVTRIERTPSGVRIASTHGGKLRSEAFDRLVIACDPSVVLPRLDASAFEQHAFSRIRTYPYSTVACEIAGLASGRESIGYVDENMTRTRAGHPMAWVKRHADRDIYIVHLFAPDDVSDAELARRIAGDVARLGGRLVRVHHVKRWRFFPHFDSGFMQAGGLAQLDRWQGRHHTYVIGEVLSFATLARVTEHAIAFAHRIADEPARRATARLAS